MAEIDPTPWYDTPEFVAVVDAAINRQPLLIVVARLSKFFTAHPTIYPDDVERRLRRLRIMSIEMPSSSIGGPPRFVFACVTLAEGVNAITPEVLNLYNPPAREMNFPLWLFGCDIPKPHLDKFDLLSVHPTDAGPKLLYMIVTSTYLERSACPEYNEHVADPEENLHRLRQSGWLTPKKPAKRFLTPLCR